jgi:RHS repeat-associated protein
MVRVKDGRITTYTYDAEDRLIRVVTPRAEVTFQYDPLGRRTEKRVIRWEDEDGDREPDPEEEGPPRVTRYLYDQEDILATFDDSGHEKARYTHGPGIDEPLAELRGNRLRYYHADTLGTIIALTGENGHPVRHYRYSAFGIPEDHRHDPQPYRFTSREWDKKIALYYYRARYYNSSVGKFLREDPIGLAGGLNLYTYARNNPTLQTDPFGLQPEPFTSQNPQPPTPGQLGMPPQTLIPFGTPGTQPQPNPGVLFNMMTLQLRLTHAGLLSKEADQKLQEFEDSMSCGPITVRICYKKHSPLGSVIIIQPGDFYNVAAYVCTSPSTARGRKNCCFPPLR